MLINIKFHSSVLIFCDQNLSLIHLNKTFFFQDLYISA